MSKALPHLCLPLWPQLPAQLLSPTPCVLVRASYSPIPNKRVLLFLCPCTCCSFGWEFPLPRTHALKSPVTLRKHVSPLGSHPPPLPPPDLSPWTRHNHMHLCLSQGVGTGPLKAKPASQQVPRSVYRRWVNVSETLGLGSSVPPHLAPWLFCPLV